MVATQGVVVLVVVEEDEVVVVVVAVAASGVTVQHGVVVAVCGVPGAAAAKKSFPLPVM